MEKLSKIIGRNVRKYRTNLGLSQMALADKASLHYNYIGRIEHGLCDISVTTLDKLVKALECDVSNLLKG